MEEDVEMVVVVIVVVVVVVVVVQSLPPEPSNIPSLSAFEVGHTPQSVCANDDARRNMHGILVTLDTSHFERSLLNDVASTKIVAMEVTLDTSHFERSQLNVTAW